MKELNQLELASQQTLPRFFFRQPTSKGHIMQLATLIVSSMALVVSCATLTVVLVGGKRMQNEVDTAKATAEAKVQQIRNAFASLV